MPTIKIPPGVMRAETRNVVPGRWHEANLIRWRSGIMSPIGGWERITKNPLTSIARNIYVWLDNAGDRHAAALCDDALYVQDENDWVERSPADLADASKTQAAGFGSGNYGLKDFGQDDEERGSGLNVFDPTRKVRFSMDNWASDLLFSHSVDGRIFVYNPTTDAVPVQAAGAPIFVQAFLVTEEKHLMCFGAQGFPNRVSWSDQENREGWDFTRVEGQAGFIDLEGAGKILTALKIPGGILVFTSTSVWLGRYTGAPYYYGFTKIADGAVPLSAHSIAVAGGRAYWMGQKSFYKYESGVVTPLTHTLGTDLFDNMDEATPRRATAGFNGLNPEIWFFFPQKVDESPAFVENDKYVIYSFEPGNEWWSDGYLSRSCYASNPIDTYPMAGNEQSYIFQHEIGQLGEGRTRAGEIYAEVSSLSFAGGELNVRVNQCMVDNAQGVDAVEFDFKGHYARGGPEYVFHEGLRGRPDGFLDTDFTAMDFSMTVRGIKDVAWGLGAMVFNKVKMRGGR